MRNHGRDPCDLEVARQTPYPLGHLFSLYICISFETSFIFSTRYRFFSFSCLILLLCCFVVVAVDFVVVFFILDLDIFREGRQPLLLTLLKLATVIVDLLSLLRT